MNAIFKYLLKSKRMKNMIRILLFVMILTNCTKPTNKDLSMNNNTVSIHQKDIVVKDTIPKVTGIGGIFFGSKNPKEMREWYGSNLGLTIDDFGSPFEFRNANRPEEINYLRWSPFEQGTDYFKPSEKEFMINYRVQNIKGLVKKLRENGVSILDTIEEYEYGKFVHIMDLEGNKIELWDPVDRFFTKMGGETTK